MDLYSAISTFVADTKAKLAEANADGKITATEAFVLFSDAMERLVKAASMLDIAGSDKKAAVLAALGQFYDGVIAPLHITPLPEMIESNTVDPALRIAFMGMATWVIEIFVSKLGK